MKKYFEIPTQVIFSTEDETISDCGTYGGIAYHDEVICGCCGGIIEVNEAEIIKELPWLNISNEIIGE